MHEVIEKETPRYYYRFEETEETATDNVRPVEEFDGNEPAGIVPVETVPESTGFLGRRFRQEQTWGQRSIDCLFGIVLPVICFVLDPFIFRPQPNGQPLLGSYTGFAYSLALATILATFVSVIFGRKLSIMNAALSGLFAVSGGIALIVGLALLPLSLLGMACAMFFAALGFTPLISAFVMFRRSVVSFNATAGMADRASAGSLFMLSVLTSVVLPFLINIEFRNSALSHFLERNWIWHL